jgi:hypothetical protein
MIAKEITPQFMEEKVVATKQYEFPVYKEATKEDGSKVQILDVRQTQRSRISLEEINAQIAILQEKKSTIEKLTVVASK